MTHDEMITVIAHHKNGGEIEYRLKADVTWRDAPSPWWDFDEFDYRAKPKPLVLWHLVKEDGECCGTYHNRKSAEKVKNAYNKSHLKKLTLKKFVEVTE